MARRRGAQQPDDGRLDPVRWSPPGRRTLVRLAAVAALLGAAALAAWSGPAPTAPAAARATLTHGPATGPPGDRPGGAPAGTDARPGGTTGDGGATGQTAGGATGQTAGGATGSAASGAAGHADGGATAAGPGGAPGSGGPARPGVPRGTVGVPVRPAEPATLRLLRPGDRVDVLGVRPDGTPTAVATAALVLGVTGQDDPVAGGLLLALRPAEARRAVPAPAGGFTVVLRPDG